MDVFATALAAVFSPDHLLFLLVGVVFGLVLGILPGLGGVAGLSILLPFVFDLDPSLALAMMIGLTAVGATSDIFPAVLVGIPGTAGGAASILDGFPLAKKGMAARALSAAFIASLVGGFVGAIFLTGAIFVARPVVLSIGFGEQLLLIVLALIMVGILTGTNAAKGLASCGLGLLLGTIGTAPATGAARLSFGSFYLMDGVPLTIVALGIFAIPEIIDLLRHTTIAHAGKLTGSWLDGLKDTWVYRWLVLRCSLLGAFISALPGLGGAVTDWIAYAHVVQTTRKRDNPQFGKGDIRGVIAPESANNAKEGGALVPTLLFGIPGSGTMAVFLGGLTMLGIAPGVEMVTRHLDLTYEIVWSIAVANVMGAAICFLLSRPIAKFTTIDVMWMFPFLLGTVFFAGFQATRDWGDLYTLTLLGLIGICMKRYGWSRPALLIGFVLSHRMEASIYQAFQVYGFSFLQRPLVVVFVLLAIVLLFVTVRFRPQVGEPQEEGGGRSSARMDLAFTAALVAFAAYVLLDAMPLQFLGKIYPVTVGTITLLLLLVVVGQQAFVMYRSPSTGPETGPDDGGWLTGAARYVAPIFLILASIYLFGFVIGVSIYTIGFLLAKARARLVSALIATVVFVGGLAVISDVVVIHLPSGLLQSMVSLPWPFK